MNNKNFKKIPSIAIQGVMGIGKDTLGYIYQEMMLSSYGIDTNRYAFADVLKIMSFSKSELITSFEKEPYNNTQIEHDFDYLKKDYIKCRLDENLMDSIYSDLENEEKAKFLGIFKKKYEDMNDDDKLFLIENFKNVSELSTRSSIQIFSDYIKEKTGDAFFFSDALMEKIHKENGSFEGVVNTDPRYLVEVINLLLNDFILVKLINDDIISKYEGKIHREHVSETELSLNEVNLGLVLNVTGKNEKVEGKIRRMKKEDIIEMLNNELMPILKDFNGYSAKFKDDILKLKGIMKDDKNILDLQNKYSGLYKARMDIIRDGKSDPTPVEEDLKNIYDEYKKYREKYLNIIKELLDNEMLNIKTPDNKITIGKKNMNKLI